VPFSGPEVGLDAQVDLESARLTAKPKPDPAAGGQVRRLAHLVQAEDLAEEDSRLVLTPGRHA